MPTHLPLDLLQAAKLRREELGKKTYETISISEAKSGGYHAVTSWYTIRLYEEKHLLERAIQSMAGTSYVLVRNKPGNKIAIWRK